MLYYERTPTFVVFVGHLKCQTQKTILTRLQLAVGATHLLAPMISDTGEKHVMCGTEGHGPSA